MSAKDLKIGCGILMGCLFVFGLLLTMPRRSFDKTSQTLERDGNRQIDHKYVDFTPHSTSMKDHFIKVSSDAMKALTESGIKNLPEVYAESPKRWIWRNIGDDNFEYTISVPTKLSASQVISFYAAQLSGPGKGSRPSLTMVQGLCPDKKSHLLVHVDPSGHRFWLELSPGK